MDYNKKLKRFINKSKNIHGDKYDYSLVVYKDKITNVKIICPEHGIFEQRPDTHLRGSGCKKCFIKKISSNKNDFIKKCNKVHGEKYDYSLIEYKNSHTKIDIICPEHGVFKQKPNSHLNGQGCPNCNKLNLEDFIKKSNKIHKKKYNYKLVNKKISYSDKIDIICPEHGVFKQKIGNHLMGIGCPKCAGIINTEDFIEKSIKIHDNEYDYSLTKYKNCKTKVKIICKKHGVFETLPNIHINGSKCMKCFIDKITSNTNIFIEKSIKLHGNKYDYSLVDYKNNRVKVKIICPVHGVFLQTPNNHLSKNVCPVCNDSKGENEIRLFLKKQNINYETQKTYTDCRNRYTLPFDFYLTDYNICIEFDGIQHFKSIEYFGGDEGLKYRKNNDEIKNNYCKENNIQLIRIKYNDNINEKMKKICQKITHTI
jgi:very-short-patch-repair endonuclease